MTRLVYGKAIPLSAAYKPTPKPTTPKPTTPPMPAPLKIALLSAKVERLEAEAANFGVPSRQQIADAAKALQKREGGDYASAVLRVYEVLKSEERMWEKLRVV